MANKYNAKEDLEWFMSPVCRVEAETEWEATDKILEALTEAGIEVRGWK